MNICKIYLHEEKFSLKTQLETERKTFIQLDCKGRSTWIWVGRLFRQSGYSGIPLGEDIVEEGDYTSTEISLGSEWFKPHIGDPSLGFNDRKLCSLCMVWKLVVQTGVLKETWCLLIKSMLILTYSWEQGWGSKQKLPRTLAGSHDSAHTKYLLQPL